jgi:transcriptional regulator with XRE-family HTH domain
MLAAACYVTIAHHSMEIHESRPDDTVVQAASARRLGGRVRTLRRERGLTLDALARRSGVSRAMLSTVERGERNPTLVVAARVAAGLGVSLTELVGVEERRRVVLTPRERRVAFRDPHTGFERELLSPVFPTRGVEFTHNVLPAGASTGELPPYRRGVEANVVVECGRLRVMVGGTEHALREGDALYFEADASLRFENAAEEECRYYLVVAHAAAEPGG